MAYSVFAVANAFIELSKRDGIPLTNMKLQKLVYIANGFCWATLGRPLFEDDIHAFEFGPVIPTLYNRLKRYGSSEIEDFINKDESRLIENGQAMRIVKQVWEAYKGFDAYKLSAITHQANTPWSDTWQTSRFGIISPEKIKNYYQGLLNERTEIRPEPSF